MSDISEEIDDAFAPYIIVDPPSDTPVKRRRRTKAEMEAARASESSGPRITPPKTAKSPKPDPKAEDKTAEERKAKREARKKKEEELTEKILVDFNEKIISTLFRFGVPAELLYAPGEEPKINSKPQKYVNLGADLAIPMELASSSASLMIRLQENEKVGKYVNGVGGSLDGAEILFTGITFAMSSIAYIQNLSRVATTLKMMQELKKQGQVVVDVEGREQHETN